MVEMNPLDTLSDILASMKLEAWDIYEEHDCPKMKLPDEYLHRTGRYAGTIDAHRTGIVLVDAEDEECSCYGIAEVFKALDGAGVFSHATDDEFAQLSRYFKKRWRIEISR